MGRNWFIGFLCVCFVSNVWAQLLDVRLKSGRDNFVLNEQVVVSVSVRNNSDQLAILANEKNWIQFTVSRAQGVPVAKHGNPPEGDVFVLKSGKAVAREVRLDSFFDFSEPGEYVVSAVIVIPNWGNKKIGAMPLRFQIVRGHDMATLERGISIARGGLAPVVRRYTLQKARVNGKLFMYMRVSDDNSPNFKIYNVMALGTMIQTPTPDLGFEVDTSGLVHVCFQSYARNYLYCIVNPAGDLVGRRMYAVNNTKGRPRLYKTVRGGIEISGGQRIVSTWDFPTGRGNPASLPGKRLTLPR
ncbi:MAG: hypothetical protein VX945_05130 [Verrucomicrobiota bacterium]|nr:hypothetical protein [Verrucomicrobiota bacterium]